MLFVFGFRAQKIRSKKLSVLLHKSSQHPSVSHCTVDVHFHKIIDKADGTYDIVPNSEFVISRTAYANESSCYMINNKKVQFKEVAKLLKLNGIDLNHNRFLILQVIYLIKYLVELIKMLLILLIYKFRVKLKRLR